MIYEYLCPRCEAEFEVTLPVARYQEPQFCACGAKAKRIISSPMLAFAKPECRYDSPVDGRPITSWAARRDDLARNGCQEYDPEMKKDYHRRLEREQNALERRVDETIEAAIEKMPTRKRENLQNELNAGATAAPVNSSLPRSSTVDIVR